MPTCSSVDRATVLLWIREYVCSGKSQRTSRQVKRRLLEQFQEFQDKLNPEHTILESLRDTTFLQDWLIHVRSLSVSTLRDRLFCLKGFTQWLFDEGRVDDNVFAYVDVGQVAENRQIPVVFLQENLQRVIAEFQTGLLNINRSTQCQYIRAAHDWNLLWNRREGWAVRDFEELLLEWCFHAVHKASPNVVCAQLPGLSCFFDFLVAHQRLATNPLPDFLAGFRSKSCLTRKLQRLPVDTRPEELAGAVLSTRKTPFFQSLLAPMLDEYVSHQRGLGKRYETAVYQLKVLDGVLLRYAVEEPAHLTQAMVQEYLEAEGLSARTRNKRLVHLRLFYRYLGRLELVTTNPADAWSKAPEPKFVPHVFSLREIGLILKEARRRGLASPSCWRGIETVLYLLYACGFRLSEPLNLRLCDVDLEDNLFFVAKTKFYKQRWVPFGEATRRRLQAYLRQRAELFPYHDHPHALLFLNTQGRALQKQSVQHWFREIRETLALKTRGTHQPRLHDLRHTYAVHRLYQWYSEEEDVQAKLPLLSTYLGHVDIHSTQVYLHLTDDLLRQAGRKLETLFERIVEPWTDADQPT